MPKIKKLLMNILIILMWGLVASVAMATHTILPVLMGMMALAATVTYLEESKPAPTKYTFMVDDKFLNKRELFSIIDSQKRKITELREAINELNSASRESA
jgi:hypothetical protein